MYKRAFTLIELLVVLGIIIVLASIVLVAVNGAQVQSRDATRIADLEQMVHIITDDNDDLSQFATCTGSHADVLTCTGPVTFPFKDPSYTGGSLAPCTSVSNSVCQFSISKSSGFSGAGVQNWEICSYLEVGINGLPKGPVAVSSQDPTPGHIPCH